MPAHTCTAEVQQQPQGTARFKPVKSFSCFPSGGSFESFDFAAEALTPVMSYSFISPVIYFSISFVHDEAFVISVVKFE